MTVRDVDVGLLNGCESRIHWVGVSVLLVLSMAIANGWSASVRAEGRGGAAGWGGLET